MDEFFWWVESIARSLEWEDRNRYARAMEFTGASRRQERLEQQRLVTHSIGQDHEDEGSSCPFHPSNGPHVDDLTDHIPHEHGGRDKEYSTNGEDCDYSGCRHTVKEDCPTCKGEGTNTPGDWTDTCKDCDGSGKTGRTLPTAPHIHPEPAKPYADQAKPVHKFPDNWSVKKTHTYGDLAYEGQMMTNCIQDDAEGSSCETCEGSGHCQQCEYEGWNDCNECYGEGKQDCGDCGGEGEMECSDCESSSTLVNCNGCGGKGKDGPNDLCKTCNWDKDGHKVNSESGNPHEFDPKCSYCYGSGKRTEWTPGKVDCDDCDGTGKDLYADSEDEDEDQDCHSCQGEGKVDCDTCSGNGKYSCGTCEGEGNYDCSHCDEGRSECWSCGGSDICGDCEGRSGSHDTGGAANYYQPYTHEDSKNFNRAPGGAYSLRDADNIPHVSFLHADSGDNERHAHDVLGRENNVKRPLKPEYQKRILQYMDSKIDQSGKIPGTEEKCDSCDGAKKVSQMARVPCEGCGGSNDSSNPYHGSGQNITDDGVVEHKECNGLGYKHEAVDKACETCKGTGEPTVKVGWGYGGYHKTYTHQDISDIVAGNNPKPEVMLVAKHKTNPAETTTLTDAKHANDFKGMSDYLKETCSDCSGRSALPENQGTDLGNCMNCGSQGYTQKSTTKGETHDLYAMPVDRIGENNIEYEPSSEQWKVKDGKGTKIDWDGGTKLNWQQTMGNGNLEHNAEHRELRAGQPDYVNQVLPRVAAICRTHDDFLEEPASLKCASAKGKPCRFRYMDLPGEAKMTFEASHGH